MRLDRIANLRKRRREEGEQINAMRHFGKVHYFLYTILCKFYNLVIFFYNCYTIFQDNSETSADLSGFQFFQGAHFPFSVNEKVLIKVTNIS